MSKQTFWIWVGCCGLMFGPTTEHPRNQSIEGDAEKSGASTVAQEPRPYAKSDASQAQENKGAKKTNSDSKNRGLRGVGEWQQWMIGCTPACLNCLACCNLCTCWPCFACLPEIMIIATCRYCELHPIKSDITQRHRVEDCPGIDVCAAMHMAIIARTGQERGCFSCLNICGAANCYPATQICCCIGTCTYTISCANFCQPCGFWRGSEEIKQYRNLCGTPSYCAKEKKSLDEQGQIEMTAPQPQIMSGTQSVMGGLD